MGACVTRMEVVELDTEGLTTVEVVKKSIIALCGPLGILLGKVDKIRAVWEDMAIVIR